MADPAGEPGDRRLRHAPGTAADSRWYGDLAWAYHLGTMTRASPLYWLVRRVRAAVAADLDLAPGDTVVDLGCGTGANLPHLREAVGPTGRVVGVDRSAAMLAWARRSVDDRGWTKVSLLEGDAATPPLAGPVDGVCTTFLLAVRDLDPEPIIRRWATRIDGGRFVVAIAGPSQGPLAPVANRLLGAYVRGVGGWNLAADRPAALDHIATRNDTIQRVLEDVGTNVRHRRHVGGLVHRYTARVD
jgi:SAM-dependent methyltransferase